LSLKWYCTNIVLPPKIMSNLFFSNTHSHKMYSSIHPTSIHSFIQHPSIYSPIHPTFIHSSIHPFIQHPTIHSFTHSSIHPSIHSSNIQLSIHSPIHPFIHPFFEPICPSYHYSSFWKEIGQASPSPKHIITNRSIFHAKFVLIWILGCFFTFSPSFLLLCFVGWIFEFLRIKNLTKKKEEIGEKIENRK